MNELKFEGCRSDTLLGYLKALGVLRVIATQADREARGSWDDAAFVLRTRLEREEVAKFLLESYSPTPIANPWNNSAGFDFKQKENTGKVDRASTIIRQVRSTSSSRWAAYRYVLDFIFGKYIETGLREKMLADGQKDEFVRMLRAEIPEEGLPWIDAVIGIMSDDVVYPYLFGSGGNDGRLDFTVNFIERALSLMGDSATPAAPKLLGDSLDESALAALAPGAAIGQFSARHAGGVNASSGFGADSLINPWDYVLMMEGGVCFRGAVVRRLGARGSRNVFPFAFRGVAGGYGSASATEGSRGELWLPVWNGKVGYAGLTDLFRRGRVDLPSDGSTTVVRSAAMASEAAAAAVTMGVGLGLRAFKRVAFVQRNGLAYTAVTSGEVRVGTRSRTIVARISRGVADWVERVRGTDTAKSGEIAELLREFDDTLFAIAGGGAGEALHDQELLFALASLEFAIARKAPERPSPLPYLDARVIEEMRDGAAEHRLAAALSSLGGREQSMRMRLDLEHVAYDEAKHRLAYDRSREPRLSRHIEDTLCEICERRVHLAREGGEDGWLVGTRYVHIDDVARMLESERDDRLRKRLARLLVAYSILEPPHMPRAMRGQMSGAQLPAAYAVMKVVIDHSKARDPRIVAYLRARDPRRAVELAARRARAIDGLPAHFRDIIGAHIDDPRWYASALLVPIERATWSYRPLLAAALVKAPSPGETEHYLRTTFPDSNTNKE